MAIKTSLGFKYQSMRFAVDNHSCQRYELFVRVAVQCRSLSGSQRRALAASCTQMLRMITSYKPRLSAAITDRKIRCSLRSPGLGCVTLVKPYDPAKRQKRILETPAHGVPQLFAAQNFTIF